MNLFNKTIIVIVLLLSPLIAQPSLTIGVSLQKDTFIVGENIDVYLTIKNISNSIFNPASKSFIKINLIKDNGTKIDYRGFIDMERKWMSKTELQPNEEDYILVNLTFNYADKSFKGVAFKYLSADKYHLELSIDLPQIIAETKSISFSVIEPQGDEVKVFESFVQLASNRFDKQWAPKFLGSLEELHKNYPNSIYSPMILDVIISCCLYGAESSRNKGLTYMKESIENYSWSSIVIDYLPMFLPTLSSKSEKVEFLQKILSKNGNSLTHKLIERQLLIESQK